MSSSKRTEKSLVGAGLWERTFSRYSKVPDPRIHFPKAHDVRRNFHTESCLHCLVFDEICFPPRFPALFPESS